MDQINMFQGCDDCGPCAPAPACVCCVCCVCLCVPVCVPVPAGGVAVVEVEVLVPGNYTLIDHSIFRIDKGAIGFLKVRPPDRA